LTYNFAPANTETTTHKLHTLTTKLLLVSQPQNCELKQELCTLATEFYQPLQFRNRERKYFLALAGLVWNCSEIATSRRNFVLTLNRASALTVEGNEQNILLRQIIVATTNRVGLESKLHHSDFEANCLF